MGVLLGNPSCSKHLRYTCYTASVENNTFPLTNKLMRPFPQRYLNYLKRIFNFLLSRVRHQVELKASNKGMCIITTHTKVIMMSNKFMVSFIEVLLSNYICIKKERAKNFTSDISKDFTSNGKKNHSIVNFESRLIPFL